MVLEEIQINNFRNYDNLKLKFSPNFNIIYGNNAQGKTNLLESIYVLGLTHSHRLNIDNNLIKTNCSFCKIKGSFKKSKLKTKLEIEIDDHEKKLKIDNNLIKKVSDYIQLGLNIIIFYPEDLEIIKGSPNIRRNYLNLELSQLSDNYLKILTEYNKLLKIRNDYLKKLQKNMKIDDTYFEIVTNYLIDKAILLYKMRKKFVDKINENCASIFYQISSLKNFYIVYKPNISIDNELDKEILLKKYKNNLSKDIKVGTTLIGPHRDDIEFYLDEKNMKDFASQGQQRLAILCMKLSEINIFKQYKGTNPILLLDDVFSELDDIKKNNVIKYIGEDIQVFITTTDLKRINKKSFVKANIIKIKDGKIIRLEEVEKNDKQ